MNSKQEKNLTDKIPFATDSAQTPQPIPPAQLTEIEPLLDGVGLYYKERDPKLHEAYLNGVMLGADLSEDLHEVVMTLISSILQNMRAEIDDQKQKAIISTTQNCIEQLVELIDFKAFDIKYAQRVAARLIGTTIKLHKNLSVYKI